jgi:hypothetical protein
MKFQTSTKTSDGFGKKPRIPTGFYPIKFLSHKQLPGVGGKYNGERSVLEFGILDPLSMKPLQVESEIAGKKVSQDLVIAQVVYTAYPSKKDPTKMQTAFTPNSRLTQTFQAMGWSLQEGKDIEIDDYIGKVAGGFIDDYTDTWKDRNGKEEKYVCSSIQKITTWQGQDRSKQEPLKVKLTKEEYDRQIDAAEKQVKDGLLTEKGFQLIKEAMEKEMV